MLKKNWMFIVIGSLLVATLCFYFFSKNLYKADVILKTIKIESGNLELSFSNSFDKSLNVDFTVSRYGVDNFKWLHFKGSNFGNHLSFNPNKDGDFICYSKYEKNCSSNSYRSDLVNSINKYGLDSILVELRINSVKFDPETMSNELFYCRVVKGEIRSSQNSTDN